MKEAKVRQAIPKAVKERVKKRFDGRCGYCGEKPPRLFVDHMTAFERCRHNEESNLMPSCFSCNNFKGVFDVETFRREVAAQVVRANLYSVNYRMAKRFGLIAETPKPIIFHFEKESK